jgi:hypothetical protein
VRHRTQVDVTLNHVNPNVLCTREREARNRTYKILELGGDETYELSAD